LSILDEFTRECLGIWVATSILAQDVIAFLAVIFQKRTTPVFLRSDNGSEFTAEAVQTWLEHNKVVPPLFRQGSRGKTASSKVSMTSFGTNACNASVFTRCWKPKL